MTSKRCRFFFPYWLWIGRSLFVVMILVSMGCSSSGSFKGTKLTSQNPAPDFHLQNQFGDYLSLTQLQGKVVVLTFIYTQCPDICLLVTDVLRMAHNALGQSADQTTFVAISVDPSRDTPEQLHRYSEQKEMLHKWMFFTGSEDNLSQVWQSYYIAADRNLVPETNSAQSQLVKGLGASSPVTNPEVSVSEAGYLIAHSSPVYLIDRSGRLRVLYSNLTLNLDSLVHDIQSLIR